MPNVLEKIVVDKRHEIEERKRAFPLSSFKDELVPSQKSLFAALSQPNAGYIFECKKSLTFKGAYSRAFRFR